VTGRERGYDLWGGRHHSSQPEREGERAKHCPLREGKGKRSVIFGEEGREELSEL